MATSSSRARTASSTSTPLELTRTERVILEAIARRAVATYDMIIGDLYGADPNGGPDDPRNVIQVLMVGLRRQLRARGLEVRKVWGEGYRIDDGDRQQLRQLLEWRSCCPTCGQPVPVS